MGRHYRFERHWQLPGRMHAVYDVLVDLERYPRWWPQIRAVVRLGHDHALVMCRSVLPVTLDLELRPVTRDRERGRLEVLIDGDLVGWSRFTLVSLGDAVQIGYEQQVEARRRLLDAGRWARPVVIANHAWMMRGAERGLSRRLSEAGVARSASPHA